VTIPTSGDETIEEYAVKLFEAWGIGDREKDEGLLLLVAVADRAVRFEVGYGLEGVLPDGRVGGIIRGQIIPRFRAGDFAGGMEDGLVEAARFVAESKGLPAPVPDGAPRQVARRGEDGNTNALVFVLIGILVLAALFSGRGSRGRRRRSSLPWWWFGGPWGGGGGGWSSGGGFGGFGGGGGGGGFGGFGGGASGGGGATGRW
jgi:uncharacterized protein